MNGSLAITCPVCGLRLTVSRLPLARAPRFASAFASIHTDCAGGERAEWDARDVAPDPEPEAS